MVRRSKQFESQNAGSGRKLRGLLQATTRSSVRRALLPRQLVESCCLVSNGRQLLAPSRNKRTRKRTDALLRLPCFCQRTERRTIEASNRQQPGGPSESAEHETDGVAAAHEHSSLHQSRTCWSRITSTNSTEGLCPEEQHLRSAVRNLLPGTMFAGNYKILDERVHAKPHILYAQAIYSKDAFVLKFFAFQSQFENSLEKRLHLKASPYICKLLGPITEPNYPPCLVFEKGDYTLKEYLEKPNLMSDRINALRQILTALVDIHGGNVVHFDLKPENIMWFNKDHKWKLLDFGSSVFVGRLSHKYTTLVYASPEIARSALQGPKITVYTSADMWPFGKIAVEVLAGQRLVDPNLTIREVKTFLRSSWKPNLDDMHCERQAWKLISKLLVQDPIRRITALEALDQALFKLADTTSETNIFRTI